MASQKVKRKQKFKEEFLYKSTKHINQEISTEQSRRIKAKCIKTYRQKTVTSGSLVQMYWYPVWDTKVVNRGAKLTETTKAQENINDKNRRENVERLIHCNFGHGDLWITLGYSKDNNPDSYETCLKHTRNYIACLRRASKKLEIDLKYIYVIEKSSRGRYHLHLLTNFPDRNIAEEKWKWGRYPNTKKIKTDNGDIGGLAAYMTKEVKEVKNQRHYGWSTNLATPVISVNDTDVTKRRAERFVKDENELLAYIKKTHPQAKNIEPPRIRFSDYTDGVYIATKFMKSKENKL